MGQYHYLVNLDKRQFAHPHQIGKEVMEPQRFGSQQYGKEELVAEMGAAFLCGHAGIVDLTLDNSAAYIKGWLKQIKKDARLVVQAAAQAQRAADFIFKREFEIEDAEERGAA